MSDEAIFVYSPTITPRLEYVFSTLLSAVGIKNFGFTDDASVFKLSHLYKINYSKQRLAEEELWINSVDLLFDNSIKVQNIICIVFDETKAFFKTPESDFPFDIFAASFYLISRYEEYLAHNRDMYGRYAHENSLAFKEGFLHEPVVNIWLQHFTKILLQKFSSLQLASSTFCFLPTYDIDIAWSYLNKGPLRNAGGMVRSMVNGELEKVRERTRVIMGRQQDPFDSYEWLHQIHKDYDLNPIYFFLMANANKGYDKNILPSNHRMQQLIHGHSEHYDVGIHPSWQSGDREELLEKEINLLEKISEKKIHRSRQHYIRMKLPGTFQKLIAAGITEDYSMGYGSINGFRASYCLPYTWYDLAKEEATSLTLFPFCYMDANSYYEQHYTCQEAAEEIEHYHRATKNVNGLFISIWHNHFLGTDPMFKGWREVYRTGINRILKE